MSDHRERRQKALALYKKMKSWGGAMKGFLKGSKSKGGRRGRALLMVLAGALGLAMILLTILYLGLENPTRHILEKVAAEAGIDMEIGSASVDPGGRLEFRDVKLGHLGHIDFIEVTWVWSDLLRSRVRQVRVHGVELRSSELQKLNRENRENREKKSESKFSGTGVHPFTLQSLIIGQAVIILDDLGAGIPPVPVRVGEVTPLVFANLHLGGKTSDPAAEEIQKVEIRDLAMYSPFDPMAEILTFEKITLAFSWKGIQEHQIDRLVVENPMIYVGDDLFWFVDQIQQQQSKPMAKESVPWTLANFSLVGGRLRVMTLGMPGFTLPVIYQLEQAGLVLADFSNVPLKMNLVIPPTNLNYPEYGIRISNMNGKMEFSLPAGEKTIDNIVNTVFMDSISWKGVTATDAWVTVTFDKNGIYCKLGGDTYGGYTEGKLSILLNGGLNWSADASITDTGIEAAAEKLIPEYISFQGKISGVASVQGTGKDIQTATGEIFWNEPGHLSIVAVDDLLKKLPEEWVPLKKDAARIALSSFRDYDYYDGRCRFGFHLPESFLDLQFDGMQGKRNFLIHWKDLRKMPRFGW